MFSNKELRKSIRVIIPTPVTHSLQEWLSMKFIDLCGTFNLRVQSYQCVANLGIETLSDLLLFSKKGLLTGKGLTTKEFETLPEKDKERINYMQKKSIFILVNPTTPWPRKVGTVSMKEIEDMLAQLGLKLG